LAQYTLQVVPDSRDQTFMGMDGGDPYSGGQYGGYPTDDLRFRIYASMSSGVGFRVNENGSVGIRSEDTLGYTLAVNGSAAKTGGGSWSSFSDGRLKDLSGEYALGLEEVLALRPYTYRYKDKNPLNILEKGSFIGPVAQEVRGVIPQAVETAGNGYLLVNNEPIFWAMVNAFKELDSRTRETLPGEEQAVPAADAAGEDMGFASEKDASVHTAGASADSHGAVGPYGPTVQLLPSIETVTPGDVLVMIPENGDELYPCALAADPAVVGIAGEGTVLSEEGAVREIPVVLGGITLCKADAAYGSIRRGDLLVASPTPGHAMKMQAFAPGTVVAKALESLETGTGTIRVLVMLR